MTEIGNAYERGELWLPDLVGAAEQRGRRWVALWQAPSLGISDEEWAIYMKTLESAICL